MHTARSFGTLLEVASVFLRLGLTSFGGPVAHLGYVRTECVERRAWLDDRDYADLVALCQLLPGPTSSQVVFALGLRRAAMPGALVASIAFLAPSAIAMIALAYGLGQLGATLDHGWLDGLKLAAVAVVAHALVAMATQLCPDRAHTTVALLAAAVVLVFDYVATQIVAIVLGALAGLFVLPSREAPARATTVTVQQRRARALAYLTCFALLFVVPRVANGLLPSQVMRVFEAFYRAGALVFSGGHIVMPLLRTAVVAPGWVSDSAFVAGYGATQAMPGPLFSFAGYLGAAMSTGPWAWAAGLGCLLAVFLPGWLLVAGVAPFWEVLREHPTMHGLTRGANASVVGVLAAALYCPITTESIAGPLDVVVASVGFLLLLRRWVPPWGVVVLSALAGRAL